MVIEQLVETVEPRQSTFESIERELRRDERLPGDVISAIVRAAKTSANSPLASAFLTRGLNALTIMILEASQEDLAHAVSASSDVAVVYRALEFEEILDSVTNTEDFFAEARLRGIKIQEEILQEEGGTFSAVEVAALLGISRQAVDKRRSTSSLLALDLGRRGYRYPVWQFQGKTVLAGFADILRAMPIKSPWTQASFFLGGNIYLDGERPLDELRAGRIDEVLRAARAFGEHGAP